MRNIICIIGYPKNGKTTFGKLISKELNIHCYSTDVIFTKCPLFMKMVKKYPVMVNNKLHHYGIFKCVSTKEFKDNGESFFEFLSEQISHITDKTIVIEGYALQVLKDKIKTHFYDDNVLIIEMKKYEGYINGKLRVKNDKNKIEKIRKIIEKL